MREANRHGIIPAGSADTPGAAHVASLAPSARASVAASLHRAARIAEGHAHADGLRHPWHRMAPDGLAKVRADLRDGFAPATANASLAAIRGAIRSAWLRGELENADRERLNAAAKGVRGKAAPGRVLTVAEVGKLFAAAAADPNAAAAARDAALLALAFGLGMRRAEIAAATVADVQDGPDGGTLLIHGKGRRQRLAPLGQNGAAAALSAWLAIRGTDPGPILAPVNKGGKVLPGGMSLRAIGKRVAVLGERAGLGKLSPHVLRRSFATALLAAGNDLAVTADLMGHARTDTTRLYDRRGEEASRAAAATLPVPYVRPGR